MTLSSIPVIELPPTVLSSRPSPLCGGDSACASHLQACRADAGLGDLSPLAPQSWQIPVSEFTGNALKILLDLIDSEILPPDGREFDYPASPLPGGIALLRDEQLLVEPRCCCDLTSLEEWYQALDTQNHEGDIWIGHAWLHWSTSGQTISFLEMNEVNEPVSETPFAVERNELASALALSLKERSIFSARLVEAIAVSGRDWPPRETAFALAGIEIRA